MINIFFKALKAFKFFKNEIPVVKRDSFVNFRRDFFTLYKDVDYNTPHFNH
jgi:hypothetical protein